MILGYSMLDLQYFLIKIRDFIMPLYQGKTFVKEWFLLSVTIIVCCKCIISWMLRPDLIDEATRYSLQILVIFYCSAFVSEFDENATAWISAPIRSPVSTVSDGSNSNASKSWKSTFFLGVLTTGCWPGDYGTETRDWPWRGHTVNGSALVMGRDQNPRHVLIIRTEIWRSYSGTRLQNHKT